MPAVVEVTAGVIARDGRVLICQRRLDGHHPGKWEFPGGKVEPGESVDACMRRELEEELGIDATVGPVMWTTRYRYPGRDPIVITFFRIPRYAGSIVNRVFAAVDWISIAELASVDFLEGDREFVDRLVRGQRHLE